MAEEKKVVDKHDNIFKALSAFQGENPEIKKTKDFGKEGEKMHFKYADVSDVLDVVRPLLKKHGLSITWEGGGEGLLLCALYHETYSKEYIKEEIVVKEFEGVIEKTTTPVLLEKNVLRTLPIKVRRDGDMKGVGMDSTYARRYTLSEVLGLASEEDKDIGIEKTTAKNAQGYAYKQAKKNIDNSQTPDEVEKQIQFLTKEIALVEGGKPSAIGLQKEQLEELGELAKKKGQELLEDNSGQQTIK